MLSVGGGVVSEPETYNLDPAKLSDTLTDGLRPVDDDLIAEAARSFDDMEAVATTLEGLTAADEATRTEAANLFATEDLKGAVRTFLEQGPGHATYEGR